jgi:hypothetical protein
MKIYITDYVLNERMDGTSGLYEADAHLHEMDPQVAVVIKGRFAHRFYEGEWFSSLEEAQSKVRSMIEDEVEDLQIKINDLRSIDLSKATPF